MTNSEILVKKLHPTGNSMFEIDIVEVYRFSTHKWGDVCRDYPDCFFDTKEPTIYNVKFIGKLWLDNRFTFVNCDFTKILPAPGFVKVDFLECKFVNCILPTDIDNWTLKDCTIVQHGMEWTT